MLPIAAGGQGRGNWFPGYLCGASSQPMSQLDDDRLHGFTQVGLAGTGWLTFVILTRSVGAGTMATLRPQRRYRYRTSRLGSDAVETMMCPSLSLPCLPSLS